MKKRPLTTLRCVQLCTVVYSWCSVVNGRFFHLFGALAWAPRTWWSLLVAITTDCSTVCTWDKEVLESSGRANDASAACFLSQTGA
jgi:hypothetical protein